MITVVVANSGRCGTSLCMQMLQAAGVPLYWNRLPNRTGVNPFGHYEVDFRRWPEMRGQWLREAEGHAIKMFLSRLQDGLPICHDYQFIELKRDAQCMVDSQTVMLKHENRMKEKIDPRRTASGILYAQDELSNWLRGKRVLSLWFDQLQSGTACQPIADFLGLDTLAVAKMRECVEPSLWHFKPGAR